MLRIHATVTEPAADLATVVAMYQKNFDVAMVMCIYQFSLICWLFLNLVVTYVGSVVTIREGNTCNTPTPTTPAPSK